MYYSNKCVFLSHLLYDTDDDDRRRIGAERDRRERQREPSEDTGREGAGQAADREMEGVRPGKRSMDVSFLLFTTISSSSSPTGNIIMKHKMSHLPAKPSRDKDT